MCRAGAPSADAFPSAPVARGAAAKWLLLGALGGSLATAGLVEWRLHRAASTLVAERTARAERLLTRFPNDPHAADMRGLARARP